MTVNPQPNAAADELEKQLTGPPLRVGEPGYEEARPVWNGTIDRHPATAGSDDAGVAGDAPHAAAGFAVAWLLLVLAAKVSQALVGGPGQVPFMVALYVLPLLYAFPGTRPVLARHRWLVLAVQTVLTWTPLVLFGSHWPAGTDGLLAGLILLMVAAPGSWLLAGFLPVADLMVRATVTGLPWPGTPAWYGAVSVPIFFLDNFLALFGLVWLADLVGRVRSARGRLAGLEIARERLRATEDLQAAVGERLAAVAAQAVAALQYLPSAPAEAGAQIAAAGISAREAAARMRGVIAGRGALATTQPAASETGRAPGARPAWLVLVGVLSGYAVIGVANAAGLSYGPRLAALAVADIVLIAALQLYHSWAAREGGRPRAWPLTLGLQAALAYAFLLPFTRHYLGPLGPFLAGSVLLLAPGRWRWAGYAAVVATYPVLWAITLPIREQPGGRLLNGLDLAAITAATGVMVYGLSRLAGMARELEKLDGELARMAAVRERLRVARDVHDLLGLGLSAAALKTDLIGKLLGRDDARAAAEIGELGRICAAARADIRLVTNDGQRLSLAGEFAAAREILISADINVHASVPAGPLPAAADDVLVPVLREAVTNILRHSKATSCTIDVTAAGGVVRLAVGNDGVADLAAAPGLTGGPAAAGGSGLANLTARVQAAGGRLTTRQADGRFELIAEIPLHDAPGTSGVTAPAPASRPGPPPGRPAGRR